MSDLMEGETMTPRGIHQAIGVLLDDVGEREDDDVGLEDAWNLVREWWEIEPIEDRDSGIDPYPPGLNPQREQQ